MNNYNQMQQSNNEQDTVLMKIRRSLYLIGPITLLTHTLSVTYSIMSFNDESMGFIAIIVSASMCFLISSSHMTIYGISVLGILYVSILGAYYTRPQICYITAMSGVVIIPFWKMIHGLGSIFHCLPGRVHASMVFGIALIVLTKFFPLAIENIPAFFMSAHSSALTNPFQILIKTFETFNVLTLVLTIVIILIMILLRQKLANIPLILIFVIVGILINWKKHFLSFQDLCNKESVDCNFYILKLENMKIPEIGQLVALLPAALVLTAVLVFEQFLYLEEFQRRGKKFGGQGNLGQITTQSKVLAFANTLSGCLGGLPVCVNMFATYESFSFNQKYGFKGTKWVGLLQIPVSYCLYSFLKVFYESIPLFIIFVIVVTPMVYFLRNMLRKHSTNIVLIIILAVLNVLTHPVIALIAACFVSIYDMAQLLRPAPAQLILSNQEHEQIRQSTHQIVPQKEKGKQNKYLSQFHNRIQQIGDDIPQQLLDAMPGTPYLVYRFTGSISYLNYYPHMQEIKKQILLNSSSKIDFLNEDIEDQYEPSKKQATTLQVFQKNKLTFILSFRYAQFVDEQSLIQLSHFIEHLRAGDIKIVLTGLQTKLIQKMEGITYFSRMLQEDKKCMFSIHTV